MEDLSAAHDEAAEPVSGKSRHRIRISDTGFSCTAAHGGQLYAAIQQAAEDPDGLGVGSGVGVDGEKLVDNGESIGSGGEGLKIAGPCGGRGLCGKCRVKVLSGRTEPPNEIEAGHLSRQELDEGIRLACMLRVVDNLVISILSAHDVLTNCAEAVRTTFWSGGSLCGFGREKHEADGGAEDAAEGSAEDAAEGEADRRANRGAFVEEHRALLPVPTMDDRRDLVTRLKDSLGEDREFALLPGDMRKAAFGLSRWMDKARNEETEEVDVSIFICEGRIAGIRGDLGAANSTAEWGRRYFGVAADVGTTTIAVYLTDMLSGKVLDVSSALNAQGVVGADVITRISCTLDREDGLEYQQKLILEQLQGLIQGMMRKRGISAVELLGCTLTGNSTMMHLLAGIDPVSIARFPYVPVFSQSMVFPGAFFAENEAGGKVWSGRTSGAAAEAAAEAQASAGETEAEAVDGTAASAAAALKASAEGLLFPALPHCSGLVMPGVSAYIGPDIAAGIVACGMDISDKPVLFVDIGTNGEMVLGGASGLYGCAAAAGPAFEGAVLSCGSGGVPGAVDRVFVEGEELHFTTIQGAAARSICGSGVVDIIAVLLNRGLIDARGKFTTPSLSAADFTELKHRRRRIGGKEAFVLVSENVENVSEKKNTFLKDVENDSEKKNTLSEDVENDSEKKNTFEKKNTHGKPVYITQQDIRELQLAKAAIAVGIDALIRDSGISSGEVEKLIVAGGFGSSMDPENALRIGLFPYEFAGRVVSAGNMAGRGALDALLDGSVRSRCEKVRDNFTLVELASSASFQRELMKQMYFSE